MTSLLPDVLSREPALLVLLCWGLFAATHIGMATGRVRAALVARFGRVGFTYVYSAVAYLTFGLLVHVLALYQDTGTAAAGLGRYAAVQVVAAVLIVVGLVLVIAAFQKAPVSALAQFVRRDLRAPWGLERITRHPLFIGAALLGLGHALLATHLVGFVAFGLLAVYGIVGSMHQDRKLRAALGAPYGDYLAVTSMTPFAAILAGRQQLVLKELPWTGIVLGVAAVVGLWTVHDRILADGGVWAIGFTMAGTAAATIVVILERRRQRSKQAV